MNESVACSTMGIYERRATECRVAAAIGNAQDVVYEMMAMYNKHNRSKVAEVRAKEEAHWQDTREERRRYVDSEIHDTRMHAEQQRNAQRDNERRERERAILEREDEDHERRSAARKGGATSITRAMSQRQRDLLVGGLDDRARPTRGCSLQHCADSNAHTASQCDVVLTGGDGSDDHVGGGEGSICIRTDLPTCSDGDTNRRVTRSMSNNSGSHQAKRIRDAYDHSSHRKRNESISVAKPKITKRLKAMPLPQARIPPARVCDLRVEDRWHCQPFKHKIGWNIWFQESPSLWSLRFTVQRSKLMDAVEDEKRKNNAQPAEAASSSNDHRCCEERHMLGMYAARRYKSLEPLTVYVGVDIGAVKGELDDYKGYRALDAMACNDEGRHVMQIGSRLIDGAHGYTCAQYINSAYRVKGWINKAEMANQDNAGGGGTIRVMENRVIQKGEEILMAYHDSYWSRWAPDNRRRGRKRKAREQQDAVAGSPRRSRASSGEPCTPVGASSRRGDGNPDSGGVNRGGGMHAAADSPNVGELRGDGGGFGRRVRDEGLTHMPNVRGKKRGRPSKRDSHTDVPGSNSKRSKPTNISNKRLRWTATSREEFCRAQSVRSDDVGASGKDVWQSGFGRGEGGGVT